MPKKTKFITKGITKELLGWPSSSACPEGHWNKGALTTTFLEFLEDFTSRRFFEQNEDEVLRLIATSFLLVMVLHGRRRQFMFKTCFNIEDLKYVPSGVLK